MRIRFDLALVGAFSVVGFALRAAQFRQGLWGDELLALEDLSHSFGGMLDALRNGPENSPPLYFTLAWLARRLGSNPDLIRLPSLLLGTATIPIAAWIGFRTVGRWAGVAGAGFLALCPFAIYYSAEGRPYATLMFTAVLSVLLLLVALDRGTTRWWVAYGLSLAAVLYSHYTGVFVVAGQLGWALWVTRTSPRGVLIAGACGALAFAPWVPSVKGNELDVYSDVATVLGLTRIDSLVTWLTGLPFLKPREMPGVPALALLGSAILLGLGGLVLGPRHDRRLSATAVLIVVLATVTPAGVFAYSLFSDDLFVFPRNLLASLPFAGLALGWLLVRLPARVAAAALGLAGLALTLAAANTLSGARSRPDFPQVASYVDGAAGERDVVVYQDTGVGATALASSLGLYLHRPHRAAVESDPSRWAGHLRSGRLVVITTWPPGESAKPLLPGHALKKDDERLFPGIQPMAAAVYSRDPLHGPGSYSLGSGRLTPARGSPIPIRPSGVEGVIQPLEPRSRTYLYSGWAHHAHLPVDKIVVFAKDRIIYADAPDIRRPDVAGDPRGGQALGFDFEIPLPVLRSAGNVTAYALWDGAAYKLGYLCEAKVEQPIPCPEGAIRP